jgi:hypothetical protein
VRAEIVVEVACKSGHREAREPAPSTVPIRSMRGTAQSPIIGLTITHMSVTCQRHPIVTGSPATRPSGGQRLSPPQASTHPFHPERPHQSCVRLAPAGSGLQRASVLNTC